MTKRAFALDRVVRIHARPETVFRFFTDPGRWAAWWGAGSTIDARAGGRVFIRYPNGIEASGEVLDVRAPETIAFTFGYESGQPIPPGSSRVAIRVEADGEGSRLHLTHEFDEASVRDAHVGGWRYQLSVFANVVGEEVAAEAPARVDAWFAAWAEPDDGTRERALAAVAAPDVCFRDRFSLVEGLAELVPHVKALQQHMPDVRLERRGDLRHCQGTLLAEWAAVKSDGTEAGRGTNVFELDADGRIARVTGLWA